MSVVMTSGALASAINVVKPFFPKSELRVVVDALEDEEGSFFAQKLLELATIINSMPKTYQTREHGGEATVHLHYFVGGCDWYITEKDMEGDGTEQAFGWAVLNNDLMNAELGYISIAELVELGAELDLYWTAKPLREVKASRGH